MPPHSDQTPVCCTPYTLLLCPAEPFVSRLSVSYMLDWHTLHLGSKAGWVNVATHLTTAVLTSGIMMAVVRMGGQSRVWGAVVGQEGVGWGHNGTMTGWNIVDDFVDHIQAGVRGF